MFTDTKQRIAKKRWQIDKYHSNTLENVETNFVTTLESEIDKAYHTVGTIMGATVFGTLTAPQNIARMQQNYGNIVIREIKKVLLRLNYTMD